MGFNRYHQYPPLSVIRPYHHCFYMNFSSNTPFTHATITVTD